MNNYATKFLGKTVTVTMDRPLHTKHPKHGFVYELNYGYIKGVMAPDGEELDAYVMGIDMPCDKFVGRCIAIIHRTDDDDDKLIVVPEGMEVSDEDIIKKTHFQEQYFKSIIIRS